MHINPVNASMLETCFRSLGNLQYLRIWHDNTGIGDYASWFLGAIIVRDVQTGRKYQFANDRWLAVEYADGEVQHNINIKLNKYIKTSRLIGHYLLLKMRFLFEEDFTKPKRII